MTKKHFNALAAALRRTRPNMGTEPLSSYAQWSADVMAITGVLQESNPRFARTRFLAACGMEGRG